MVYNFHEKQLWFGLNFNACFKQYLRIPLLIFKFNLINCIHMMDWMCHSHQTGVLNFTWMEEWRVLLRAQHLQSFSYNHRWLMSIHMRSDWFMFLTCPQTLGLCLWLGSKCITIIKLLLQQDKITSSFTGTAKNVKSVYSVQCIPVYSLVFSRHKVACMTYIIGYEIFQNVRFWPPLYSFILYLACQAKVW